MTLAFHEFANLFPLIEGHEFFEFADDIRLNGLRKPIDMLGDKILDGRNRYRALVWIASSGEPLGAGWDEGDAYAETMAGKPLDGGQLALGEAGSLDWLFKTFRPERDGDPLTYVLSENLQRRHLTDDQRRMVGARLVTMKAGRPTEDKTSQIANITRESAAEIVSADVAGLDRARSVIAHGVTAVVDAVDAGKITVAAAAEIAAQPQERQAEIFANLPRDADGKLTANTKKALAPVIKEIRKEKVDAKRERRAEREQEFGRKVQSLPEAMFGIAIEDFEWDHEPYSRETGLMKHPSMHYETATEAHTPEEIVARCAERFACLAPDCILFKWTTLPHAYIAMQAMALQGFRYVTQLAWNKERSGDARGTGYWVTGEHEIVLVGVRGKVVPPAFAHFRSNFSAPVGGHSEKPPNVHEIVEYHWPSVPKVEFNARAVRPGWAAWGFDAPDAVADADQGWTEWPFSENEQAVSHETASVVQPLDLQALPLDLPEQHAPVSAIVEAAAVDVVEVFRRELSADEFAEWQALDDSERIGFVILPDMARHLLGEGLAVEGGDGLALTADGETRLRALRAHVERTERRQGRTLGYSLDINPPSQVDIEDLLRGAA